MIGMVKQCEWTIQKREERMYCRSLPRSPMPGTSATCQSSDWMFSWLRSFSPWRSLALWNRREITEEGSASLSPVMSDRVLSYSRKKTNEKKKKKVWTVWLYHLPFRHASWRTCASMTLYIHTVAIVTLHLRSVWKMGILWRTKNQE